MKVFIITLGCKVNQYESESMLEILLNAGFTLSESTESADVIIINSCTVTSVSDQKVRQIINRSKNNNPNAIIVLTGCMPQAFPELMYKLDKVDIVLGNSNRKEILPAILEFSQKREKIVKIHEYTKDFKFEPIKIKEFKGKSRAFIKIEDGCNRFCSYCIIPYARGRVRSKPLDELKAELENLALIGYKEIVLVGINLSCYGQDIGSNLCEAIETACSIKGIDRVRLGSLEPEQMNIDVIKRISKLKKLCPQFHLSLQSGSDKTLKRMNRHYDTKEYLEIVNNLRDNFENVAITTDVMVGFPGESEEEFNESLNFVKKIGFAKMHVFAYSRRPGTKADKLDGQITNKVKSQRSKEMIITEKVMRQNFMKTGCGKVYSVLFETVDKNGYYEGYTENYVQVKVKSPKNICGCILDTKITSVEEDYCYGEI